MTDRWRLQAVVALLALAAGARQAPAFTHLRVPAAIPTRDGKTLAADVYLPATSGRFPTVLIQTPYDKTAFRVVFPVELGEDALLKSPDYAFVVLDWRGFYGSTAAAVPGYDRGLDGYDAVEWIAAQNWSDGRVGTWGASALGMIQFQTAAKHPPHLVCAVPIVAHMHDLYELYYPGGVYARNKNTFVTGHFGVSAIADHPLRDGTWIAVEAGGVQAWQIDVPMLHVSGWYDHETAISLQVAAEIQTGGGAGARGRQKVLVGPWSHSHVGKLQQGQLAYPAAVQESSRMAKEFFDFHLRGVANGWEERPTFRTFRINDDLWRDAETWPPAATALRLYPAVDRALVATPPAAGAASLAFTSDPADPVPTLFGAILIETNATQGPGDLAAVEARGDVLAFSTPPLAAPLSIEGAPKATLWITCDAVDTDVAVRLTEVLPDGRSLLLVDGIRRASLRASFAERAFLQPGVAVPVTVTLPPVAVTIPAGHRLRLDVAAANFDRFDRNMQDGSPLSDSPGARPVRAEVRLLMDAAHPSSFDLPVVEEHRVRRHLVPH